ncbi:MAG: transglutaminase [Mesorhizobium amorphae]|nr:MAG: transglutaminase [Mesorhizobium amorphae]
MGAGIVGKSLVAAALIVVAGLSSAAQASSAMPTGGRSTQPIGHWEFCQSNPAPCAVTSRNTAPIRLTKGIWSEIVAVNNRINAEITPMTDMEMWGREEFWSYPDGRGDCEDYVLEKQRALMALGLPASSLLITVVRQPNGDGHAVLTARTDRGDFILDNLEPRVLGWLETDYTFLKRQSERSASAWTAIEDGRSVAVGSVR